MSYTTVSSKRPTANTPSGKLQKTPQQDPISFTSHITGDLSRQQTLLRQILIHVVSTCTAAQIPWSGVSHIASQPKVGSPKQTANINQDTVLTGGTT